jgi:hypothetical protein
MTDVSLLGQYGIVGVMLALVALTGSAVWILYKVVCNHLSHNTIALEKMSNTMEKLNTLIETKL